jgi:hypothetical protein
MHLRVQDVSNFLAVGGLGSGSVRLTDSAGRGAFEGRASISRFCSFMELRLYRKPRFHGASAGPENTQFRTAQIVNSGRAEIYGVVVCD